MIIRPQSHCLYGENLFRVEGSLAYSSSVPWASQLFLHFLTKLGKPFTFEQKVASARRMTRLSEFGLLKGRETETDHNLRAHVSADAVWVAYFCSKFWLICSVTWACLPEVVSFLFYKYVDCYFCLLIFFLDIQRKHRSSFGSLSSVCQTVQSHLRPHLPKKLVRMDFHESGALRLLG